MSTITQTTCPTWCNAARADHVEAESGIDEWALHSRRANIGDGLYVELTQADEAGSAGIYVSQRPGDDLTPREARLVAVALLQLADLGDGRQRPTVEVVADTYEQEVRIFAPSPLPFGAALSLAWNIEEGIRAALAAQIEAQA